MHHASAHNTDVIEVYKNLRERIMEVDDVNMILSHSGDFSQDLVNGLAEGLERVLLEAQVESSLIKRMFSIMIEGLQNIRIHGRRDAQGKNLGYVIVRDEGNCYRICFGNPIAEEQLPRLEEHLEQLKRMSAVEAKEYYLDTLRKGMGEDDDSIGLGLVTMYLRADCCLDYRIFQCQEKELCFGLSLAIEY
jgi:hypothetical protein